MNLNAKSNIWAGSFGDTFNRLSSLFSNSASGDGSQSDFVINGATLRISDHPLGGLEIDVPGGRTFIVEKDEVSDAMLRISPLFLGKILRIEGQINQTAKTIKLKKVEAYLPDTLAGQRKSRLS
jgi:hypothetical protein